jgi:hypothetical protein
MMSGCNDMAKSIEIRFHYAQREYVKAERQFLLVSAAHGKFFIVFVPLFLA